MTFTYDVAIDWDYTGTGAPDFSTLGDDITAYVMRCTGNQGVNSETENVAKEGKCTITLRNTDRRFSPNHAGSPLFGKLVLGKPVRVRGIEGSTDVTYFGFIKSIAPRAGGERVGTGGVLGEPICEIQCTDQIGRLMQSKFSTPVLVQRYAHELVQAVANRALNAPAATNELDFGANPSNNDTASVAQNINGELVNITYVFKTVLGSDAYQVLIGATKEDTLEHLCNAVNGGPGAGTTYTNATRPLGIATGVPVGYRYLMQRADPVRYYRLNELVGTTFDDIGSNGADATAVGGATLGAAGIVLDGNSVSFDGVDDYISLPTLDFANRSFSVEFWLFAASSPPTNQDLFSVFDSFNANKLVYLRLENNGRLTLDFYLTGGAIQTATGVIAFGSASNHVAITYDYSTTTAQIVVNGVVRATGTCGPYTGSSTPTVQLGAFTAAATYTKGTIDEPAIYFEALPVSTLLERYNAQLLATGIVFTATLPGTVGNTIAVAASGGAVSWTGANFSGGVDYPTSPANDFEASDTLIPFAGDDWQSDNTNGMTAIADIVKSEGTALFWAQRDGTLEFKDRGYIFRQGAVTPALVVSSTHQEAQATLSDEDTYNAVEVTIRPRRLKPQGVIAKTNNPVQVPPRSGVERWHNTPIGASSDGVDGSKVIKLQFTDAETGIRSAAQNVVLPLVATTNYTLNEQADGSGVDYTNGDPATGILYVFFSVVVNANNIEVSVVNRALGALYASLTIYGEALVKYEPITAVAEDEASQIAYGKRTLAVNLPLGSDQAYAEALAAYLLARYKEPQFRVKKLTFNNITSVNGVKLHALHLGDVIDYSDYQHAVSNELYMIRGVNWDWGSPQSGRFTTTFDVFKLDDAPYGVFDGGSPWGKFDEAVFGL
jgi:hypothetical protein